MLTASIPPPAARVPLWLPAQSTTSNTALAARYAAKGIDPEEAGEEALEVLSDYWMKMGDIPGAIECSEQLLRLLAAEKDQAAEKFRS